MKRKPNQETQNCKGIKKNFFNFRFHVTAFDIFTLCTVAILFTNQNKLVSHIRLIHSRDSIVPCGTNFIFSADTSHFVAG